MQVMERLRRAIRKKKPEIWRNNSWILHYDNALTLCQFMAKGSTNIIIRRIWPRVVLFLLPKIILWGAIEAIKRNSLKQLKNIPLDAYSNCMKDRIKRWHICIVV